MATSNIIKGAAISYIAIFLNIAISFFYTPWMIHQIGVSDYGLYSLTYSFISYFILDFGLSQAVQRFIAKYRAEGNEDKVAKMIGLTTRVYLIIDSIIFLVLLILYFFISNIFTGLTPDEIERLKGLYIIAGIFSVLSFMFKPMTGAMMAYEYFVEEKLLEMLNKVGAVSLVCVALLLGADVFALILINGAVALTASIGKFIVFKRKSNLKIQWRYYDRKELKSIFSFSAWTFGRGLAQRLRFSLVMFLLGVFCNSTEIAIFALAMTIEATIYIMSSAINGLFMPKVARISVSGNRNEILSLMIRVGRIELYIIGFIFSAFLVLGQDFIHLWVGDGFNDSYYAVLLLIFANILTFTEEIAENLVYIENKIRYTTTIILICSVIGFGFSAIFASKYGAIGCAACSGIALFVNSIWSNIFYHNKMGINIILFLKKCHMRILPTIVLLIVISLLLKKTFIIDTWINFALCAISFTLMFFACVFFVLNNEEKKTVKQLIKK